MTDRYITSTDTEHGCCHDASVRDTTKPNPYSENGFALVCECHDMEIAVMIAEALNAKSV